MPVGARYGRMHLLALACLRGNGRPQPRCPRSARSAALLVAPAALWRKRRPVIASFLHACGRRDLSPHRAAGDGDAATLTQWIAQNFVLPFDDSGRSIRLRVLGGTPSGVSTAQPLPSPLAIHPN